MAERRMFAKTIIDSDAFLDMPLSAQALYFHLAMRADDEGFVGNPKMIQRMIGATEKDCRILISKRFILTFPSGIILVTHWKIHNYIQADRFKKSTYIEEKSMISLDNKGCYVETTESNSVDNRLSVGSQNVSNLYPTCIQNASKLDTQDSKELVKDNKELIKDSSKKESKKEIINKNNAYAYARESYDEIMERLHCSAELTKALRAFIQHCTLNKCLITNDRLIRLIEALNRQANDKDRIKWLNNAVDKNHIDVFNTEKSLANKSGYSSARFENEREYSQEYFDRLLEPISKLKLNR